MPSRVVLFSTGSCTFFRLADRGFIEHRVYWDQVRKTQLEAAPPA